MRLPCGKVLTSSIFYHDGDAKAAFAVLHAAKQLATFLADGRREAEALDLLEFAHYCQQALERREALEDQRGVSESLFHIGLIYENGDQSDLEKSKNLLP